MKIPPVASVFLFAAAATTCVFAHDPYEITTEAWLRPAALEFDTMMARSTAVDVLEGKAEQIPFDPAKFEELKPRFEARGATLFIMTANDVPMPAPTVKAELTIENDVALHIVYPRPAPGTLRIDAPHVAKLGYGYGNVVTVHGDKGALLGQKMLTGTDPAIEVNIAVAPSAPTATPATVPAAVAPNSPATAKPVAAAAPKFRPGVAVAAIVAAAIFAWLFRRRVRPTSSDKK